MIAAFPEELRRREVEGRRHGETEIPALGHANVCDESEGFLILELRNPSALIATGIGMAALLFARLGQESIVKELLRDIGIAFIVAVIVTVTEPFPAIVPLQLTVFVPMRAVAVPLVAFAETSTRLEGSTSLNSLPGLSNCGDVLVLESTTV